LGSAKRESAENGFMGCEGQVCGKHTGS